jgi:hypothetical protein
LRANRSISISRRVRMPSQRNTAMGGHQPFLP